MKNRPTWRQFLESITPDFTFHSSATVDEIEDAESSLDILFPDELKSLLQESNGIEGAHGLGLIWNAERIKKDNLFFRQFSDYKDVYMPFDHLLFFADAGNGDQFAFVILNRKFQNLIFMSGFTKMMVGSGLHLLLIYI